MKPRTGRRGRPHRTASRHAMSTAAEKNRPQRRSDAKRKLLIDIGTTIFTQKGFSSTGLDEIVQRAELPSCRSAEGLVL